VRRADACVVVVGNVLVGGAGKTPTVISMVEHLRAQGLQEVYHLEGGILKYLETVAPEMSRWQGECFVFDERVSVAHGVQTGSHQLCRCCRQPLPPGALQSEHYEPGVSCPRCFSLTSETQKKSARERQRQWERAKAKAALLSSERGPSAPAGQVGTDHG
jgi:predicted sulfurtransferase